MTTDDHFEAIRQSLGRMLLLADRVDDLASAAVQLLDVLPSDCRIDEPAGGCVSHDVPTPIGVARCSTGVAIDRLTAALDSEGGEP